MTALRFLVRQFAVGGNPSIAGWNRRFPSFDDRNS